METTNKILLALAGAGLGYLIYKNYTEGEGKSLGTTAGEQIVTIVKDTGEGAISKTTEYISQIFTRDTVIDNTQYDAKVSDKTQIYNDKGTLLYSNDPKDIKNLNYDFGTQQLGSSRYIDNRIIFGLPSNQGMSYQDAAMKTPNVLNTILVNKSNINKYGGVGNTSYGTTKPQHIKQAVGQTGISTAYPTLNMKGGNIFLPQSIKK